MSPIGRVFLVLNLILAGTFVGFAGSYLEKDHNYKTLFDQKESELNKVTKLKDDEIQGLSEKVNETGNQLRMTQQLKSGLENKNKELTDEIARKEQRLAEFEATLKQLNASYARLDTELKAYNVNNKDSLAKALEATNARNAAVNAQNAAENALAEARTNITNLGREIDNQKVEIAKLSQNLREQKTLVSMFDSEYPGWRARVQPPVDGVVKHVSASGKLVTISINAGGENLKPGARFAIFNDANYKCEATVRDVDASKSFCFAYLDGEAKVEVGDKARTNLSKSGN